TNPDQPPTAGSPITSSYAGDLDKAFRLASDDFRQHLCQLDAIFLDTSDCADLTSCFGHSWGYRQRGAGAGKGRYIAISAKLWNLGGGTKSYTYGKYETDLLQQVFGRTGTSYAPG